MNNWKKVVELLIKGGFTITTMESCTGGGVASAITDVHGASTVIEHAYVTYSNEAKVANGVPENVIKRFSVYSPETAEAMAISAKKKAKTDWAIGTTGQLGRIDPKNPLQKMNLVWFSIINNEDKLFTVELEVPDEERSKQKQFVINAIADKLNEVLGGK